MPQAGRQQLAAPSVLLVQAALMAAVHVADVCLMLLKLLDVGCGHQGVLAGTRTACHSDNS